MKMTKNNKLKIATKELIKYVNDWIVGDIVKATQTYKLLSKEERVTYSLGWKMGCSSVLDKIEEIDRLYND